jgi:hypothetical protein
VGGTSDDTRVSGPEGTGTAAPSRGLWSRRLARLTANPADAIYGTIVATALTAATAAHQQDPYWIALAVVVTLLVFWLAHGYTHILGHGIHHGQLHVRLMRETLAADFAMVEAPGLSVLILLLGGAGWIDGQLSITLALANGVLQLLVWGVAVGRQLGQAWPGALGVGLVNASFGVIVIMLKALVH